MPRCQQCQHNWSFMQSIRTMLTFRMKMKCPICGKTQYLSAKSRKLSSFISLPIIVVWVLLASLQVPLPVQIVYVVIAVFGIFLLMPMFYELSNEEEALW